MNLLIRMIVGYIIMFLGYGLIKKSQISEKNPRYSKYIKKI